MSRKLLIILLVCVAFVSVLLLSSCLGPELNMSPLAAIDESAPPTSDVPTLKTVFAMLAAGAVGGIIAFLTERFEWFQSLSSKARFWTIAALSIGLPLLARVALQFVPDDIWMLLEPYWQSLALGFMAFMASQIMHAVDTRRRS